jgi:L-seryl-tRNA(Ser) seleniumtransferase
MKALRSVICLAALALAVVSAQSGAKVAGTWKLALETPHGPMPGALQLKQEGGKLTGSVDVEQMGSMALTGALDGQKISFSIEIPDNQKVTFTGTIDGDKMSGSIDHGGTWSATRGETHI